MSDFQKTTLAVVIIIGNNILGHFSPPSSISLTPVIIGIISGLFLTVNYKLIYRILLITAAVILNDILIKYYAGGTHDSEGIGWIHLFLIFGLLVSMVITFVVLKLVQGHKLIHVFSLTLLLPLLITLYLSYFDRLNMVYSELDSESIDISKKKGLFLMNLSFSENLFHYKNDTIQILYGWSEKHIRINHKGLIKKVNDSTNINYIIKVKHNFQDLYDHSVYYQINSKDINGSSPLDTVIRFNAQKASLNYLTFFKLRNSASNDTIIQVITINRQ